MRLASPSVVLVAEHRMQRRRPVEHVDAEPRFHEIEQDHEGKDPVDRNQAQQDKQRDPDRHRIELAFSTQPLDVPAILAAEASQIVSLGKKAKARPERQPVLGRHRLHRPQQAQDLIRAQRFLNIVRNTAQNPAFGLVAIVRDLEALNTFAVRNFLDRLQHGRTSWVAAVTSTPDAPKPVTECAQHNLQSASETPSQSVQLRLKLSDIRTHPPPSTRKAHARRVSP